MTALPSIALVTPYNQASAIADVNMSIAEDLARRGHAVTIFRSEVGDLASMPQREAPRGVPVVAEYGAAELHAFDVILYTSGNNYRFHGRLLELMPLAPGVVILHDFYLRHFFHEWAQVDPAGAAAIGARFDTPAPPGADELWYAENAPLTEWLASMATGAIVHGPHYIDRVAAACPGPVVNAPLPKSRGGRRFAKRKRKADQPFVVATLGHSNPNKRSEQVIRAIGASAKLRGKTRYLVLGPIDDRRRMELDALARDNDVSLLMTGWIDDSTMDFMLETADAITCLRWPLMEGASASAILAMRTGRPLIVSDAGFYSQLPDTVSKVPYGDELDALTAILEHLYEAPAQAAEAGLAAAAWAEERFTGANYVDAIASLLQDAVGLSLAWRQARWFADLAGDFGLSPNSTLMRQSAAAALDVVASALGRAEQD